MHYAIRRVKICDFMNIIHWENMASKRTWRPDQTRVRPTTMSPSTIGMIRYWVTLDRDLSCSLERRSAKWPEKLFITKGGRVMVFSLQRCKRAQQTYSSVGGYWSLPRRESCAFHTLLKIDPCMSLAGRSTFPTMTMPKKDRCGAKVAGECSHDLQDSTRPFTLSIRVPHHTVPSNCWRDDRTITHCMGNSFEV